MIKVKKIVTYCMIGTIALAGKTAVSKAAEKPVAGIDLLLNDFYQNTENGNKVIEDYLSSDSFKKYSNISFAQVTNYVNIRKEPNEESEILGKLYNDSAATVLSKKGDWYKVQSGSVTGYIKSEFLVTGAEAAKVADSAGTRIATVNTATLRVREKASTEAPIVTLVPIGDDFKVKKEVDGWIKISVDGDIGYVSSDYVDLSTVYEEAISIEEEQERLEAEEAARLASEQAQTTSTSVSESNSGGNNSGSSSSSGSTAKSSKTAISGSSDSSTSSIRSKIVNYALKFEGNPYRWGGTSLTNGADCSGFTQSVFADYGVGIPRDSRSQASGGRTISVSSVKPGDLIFYSRNGSINHVALYIGGGKVISASSPEVGIRIANYDYRNPVKAVSYLN